MKPLRDCSLYTFIDTAYLEGRDPVALARALCDGGADIIQLRAKNEPADRIRLWAEQLLSVTRPAGVWLLVNDHPRVAVQAGADGCHLGQEDFFGQGYRVAAQVTGCPKRMILGLSTHAPEQARRALRAGPDYVAIGPVYPTPTKPGAQAVTLEYVRWAARHVSIPWFAIGGIHLGNLEEVLAAGATRVGVVSALLKAPEVSRACQDFRERLASVSRPHAPG